MCFLKALSIVIIFLTVLKIVNPNKILENYVFNESDRGLVNYELIETTDSKSFITYKLNITTLRWIDGK